MLPKVLESRKLTTSLFSSVKILVEMIYSCGVASLLYLIDALLYGVWALTIYKVILFAAFSRWQLWALNIFLYSLAGLQHSEINLVITGVTTLVAFILFLNEPKDKTLKS